MGVWVVTGGSGFIGRHVLARFQETDERSIIAIGRKCPAGWPIERFLHADLEIASDTTQAIRSLRPDVVIHAAGRTPPATREELDRANVLTTTNLVDAIQEIPQTRLVVAGSAAELGPVPEKLLPVDEEYACQPVDDYGKSKRAATAAALSSVRRVLVARIFNPIGPGQPKNQALGRFAALLAGGATTLKVGDLTGRRDFIDVRDVADALLALAEQGSSGLIFHVGTGVSHCVGEALDHLIARSGRKIEIETDPSLVRTIGPRDSQADIRRITTETDWRPRIAWEQSLDDLWDWAISKPSACH